MPSKPIFTTTFEALPVSIYASNRELGEAAAAEAAAYLQQVLEEKGQANIILATGNSQLTFLEALRAAPGIDWGKVNIFHMDEYLNLDPEHPASFPLFLCRHFLEHLQPPAGAFFAVPNQSGSPEDACQACQEYEALLQEHPVDLCALGIGENGHLAFNDPPYADFNDPVWVKVVELDEASRRQQVGEGHFGSLDEVPTHAITLTIPALLSASKVLALVPEARKAPAVKASLHGPVTDSCPGSILRQTAHAHLYLDRDSAAQAFPEL